MAYQRRPAASELARLLIRAAAIAALGGALGLIANALHPMGLPLLLRDVPRPGIPRWVWRAVKRVDAPEAHRLWETNDAVFVDTRDAGDYATGHIRRSISLPYHSFAGTYPAVSAKLPRDRPMLIYCYGSSCGLSIRLAKRLLGEGYENLTVLRGGVAAWQQAGYPLTQDAEARPQ